MRRREFIAFLGGSAAWPLAARAQQPKRMRRVAVLHALAGDDPDAQQRVLFFEQELRERGWDIGHNVQIDWRWAPDEADRMRVAADLVSMQPDVIVGASTPVVMALQAATRSIPIVCVQVIDPVALGFAASLAHPGGNITGITNFEFSMGSKWLEILKGIGPQVSRVSVLYFPKTAPYAALLLRSVATAASSFGAEAIDTPVRDVGEMEHAIDRFAQQRNGALLVLPDASTSLNRDAIIARAAQNRLPALYPFRQFVVGGGLVSYGIDPNYAFRQVASYVDRLLRGTKPEDLPIQAPTKFELIINLKTATSLGFDIPAKLLALADEVIE
jgi:putative ABC transport system substrate-binding protein